VRLSASNSKNTETGTLVNPSIILNSAMRSALWRLSPNDHKCMSVFSLAHKAIAGWTPTGFV